MINSYDLADFDYDCLSFNREAGKLENPTDQDLRDQIKLIQDELNELADELKTTNPDKTQVLKEFIDTLVTTVGFGQMLLARGYNIYDAMQEVANNNLDKFVSAADSYELNKAIIESTVQMYAEKGIKVMEKYVPAFDAWVFLDEQNKVRKPYGYIPADVSKFIPTIH